MLMSMTYVLLKLIWKMVVSLTILLLQESGH